MTNKMTIKVIKTAFYNGALVYPNEIIKNYKGKEIPLWATLANGKEIGAKDNAPEKLTKAASETENTEVHNLVSGAFFAASSSPKNWGSPFQSATQNPPVAAENPDKSQEEVSAKKTEAELTEEYNTLLDEAVSKDILIDDADKKTIAEQIEELKILLGKKR